MPASLPAQSPAARLSFPLLPYGFLIIAYVVYDYVSYTLPQSYAVPITVSGAVLICLVAALNLRGGILLFSIALVFADDISRLDPQGGRLTSILTVPVAGIAVGNLVAIVITGLALIFALLEWSRRPRYLPPLTYEDRCILVILVVYLLATLHGMRWWISNPRGVLNDLNLPFMLLGLYFVSRYSLRDFSQVRRLIMVLVLAIAAKATVWSIFFVLGIGFEFGTTIKVSNESGRILLVLLFAFGLIIQERGLGFGFSSRMLGLIMAAIAAFNLLVQAQRGPWLAAALALAVLMVLGRVGDKLRWAMSFSLAAIVVVAIILQLKPDVFDTLRYHASTLQFWNTQSAFSSQSTQIRLYEFRNINAQLWNRNNLLLGEGPGSVFSDNYHPIPFGLQAGDYTWEEQLTRRFQNPHGLLQNLMLNIGYGGLAAYLAIMALFYVSTFQTLRRAQQPDLRMVALLILAFLPAIGYYSWSPKNNFMLGLILGCIGATLANLPRASEGALRTRVLPSIFPGATGRSHETARVIDILRR